ncbi:MAG: hypothetical protein HY731_11425 [Candidatus Tectomicrobia bacterium]|nr:hypothetical protein [Candidatus Tectomicrobia bacterium]
MFPHHENEITQSEGATGKKFVNFWLHSEHLLVGNTKMSKSLGNFYTLRDLLEKGYKPKVIRYGLMSTHYRQPYNFTLEGLEAAESAMQRMHDFMIRLEEADGRESDIVDLLEKARREFEEGMDDDLNISAALGAIFSFIREINRLMAESWLSSDNARTVKQLMRRFDEVLGILEPAQQEIPREVVTLVEERESARKRRDFARADQLRTKIVEMGYVVEDTPEGSRIKVR